MFGGIVASTNLPSGWVGVGTMGSMCAGLALMSLASQDAKSSHDRRSRRDRL